MKTEPNKKGKLKKNVKKVWVNAQLTKLAKKFEELYKQYEEIKETDPEEEQLQNLTIKNFIQRIITHIKDIQL